MLSTVEFVELFLIIYNKVISMWVSRFVYCFLLWSKYLVAVRWTPIV